MTKQSKYARDVERESIKQMVENHEKDSVRRTQ